jgi:hypothetical protein
MLSGTIARVYSVCARGTQREELVDHRPRASGYGLRSETLYGRIKNGFL